MMRPRFTNAGRALQLRALAGVQITFTKMQLGDGLLGETDYQTLTSLVSPKATLSLSGIKISDGSATVRGEFTNANMTEGFYYRELGLFARDPDNPSQEILYCYANFGDECQYITEPSSALISRTVRIVAVVDDAPNVTAILNDNAQYVDREELMLAIEQHNASEAAHPDLIDFDVTYYVDGVSNDDEVYDGTFEHPFRTMQEAADAIALSALRVRLILKTGGRQIHGLDDDYTFRSFQRIEVLYEGEATSRPVILGCLRFADCGVVRVEKIAFQADDRGENTADTSLHFECCAHAVLHDIHGAILPDDGIFVIAARSTVSIRGMEVLYAKTAVHAVDNAFVTLQAISITGGTYGVTAAAGSYVSLSAVGSLTNTAAVPYRSTFGGVIMHADTALDITDGTVHAHVHSTDNPHNVDLEQAQEKGGTVNVAHGGTGQTAFDAGALLKGNGNGGLAQLLGSGALYAAASGSPRFGTLPVAMGGTGRTDSGTWIQSSTTNGVLHGSQIIPGTNIVLMWGKISTGGNTSCSHSFTQYNGAAFANTDYVLVVSGQDDVWGSITKETDRFSIEVGGIASGSYVADWVAVGIVGPEVSAASEEG